MEILKNILKIQDTKQYLLAQLPGFFRQSENAIEGAIKDLYDNYLSKLRPDLYCLIEYPYIDKVYRDSYYKYFASKLNHHQKNCIRLSFFNQPISIQNCKSKEEIEEISNCLGFLVLRPTVPYMVGRNAISPSALIDNNFMCCQVQISASIESLKLKISAFPHSGQDTETITCAETSIWACLEYFGNKYPEYKPVSPSEILNILNNISHQRQLPSIGLFPNEICYVLKRLGFGTKLYEKSSYNEKGLNILLRTYIESGIPVIIGLQKKNEVGHAILGIGRNNFDNTKVLKDIPLLMKQGIALGDVYEIDQNLIFVDDNYCPYVSAPFKHPLKGYYSDKSFHGYEIDFLIVPLHSKIHLDAVYAKELIQTILTEKDSEQRLEKGTYYYKVFLASSRTYKDWVLNSAVATNDFKDAILSISMPKFIWICEISTDDSFKKSKADGIIVLDATEANTSSSLPFIIGFHSKQCWINIEAVGIKKVENFNFSTVTQFKMNLNK